MRDFIALLLLTTLVLVGCQGLGGYSAQSVTRVPPIGTGTYALPGGGGTYYGNAAPAPGTAAMMQNGVQPYQGAVTASYQNGNYSTSNLQPSASTAQYDLPSTSAIGGGVSTAGATVNSADLQWQR